MAATIQQSFISSWAASNAVTVTIDAPAVEDDVILLHFSIAGAFTQTAVAEWTNLLGPDNTQFIVSDTTCAGVIMYHVVTGDEETELTVSWTLTGLFANPESGDIIGVVWRDLDPAEPLHTFAEAENAANITPHVLAGIPDGTTIDLTNAPVMSYIIKDTLGTYTTPAGVTLIESTNTTMGTALYRRDVNSIVDVAVDPITITPSGADEYVSITYILTPGAGGIDDYVESPVDPVGITDVIEISGINAYVDPIGITDTVSAIASTLQEESDDVGITDADIVYNTELLRTDDIGIEEHVLIEVIDAVNHDADVIGIDDSVTIEVEFVGATEVDDVGITDSVVVSVGEAVTATDNIGIVDSIAITETTPDTIQHTDVVGLTDTVVRTLQGPARANICLEFGLPVFVNREAGLVLRDREAGLVFRSRGASLATRGRDASLTFVNREAGLSMGCEE